MAGRSGWQWLSGVALLAGAGVGAPAAAQDAAAPAAVTSERASDALATLPMGEQRALPERSGTLAFAGRSVMLDGCTGVVGYASQVAYLLVFSGRATAGKATAGPGRMLLLPPFGGAARVARFDAARFRAGWSARGAADATTRTALDRVVARQRMGLFTGQLQRSRLNVAASGEAGGEVGRRTLVGGTAVRDIRFSPAAKPADVEARVVDRFAIALAGGDAATVAELIDPVPFGGQAMGAPGAAARLAYARALVSARDWRGRVGTPARIEPGRWRTAGATGATRLTTRATPDFVFVSSVQVEGE